MDTERIDEQSTSDRIWFYRKEVEKLFILTFEIEIEPVFINFKQFMEARDVFERSWRCLFALPQRMYVNLVFLPVSNFRRH